AAGAATLADFALLGFLPGVFLAVVLAGFSFLLTAGASLFGLRPRFLPVAFLLVVVVGLVVVSAFTASLAWASSALASTKASFSSAPAVRNFANSAWAFLTRLCVAADFLFLLAADAAANFSLALAVAVLFFAAPLCAAFNAFSALPTFFSRAFANCSCNFAICFSRSRMGSTTFFFCAAIRKYLCDVNKRDVDRRAK